MSITVPFSTVKKMLDECAVGYSARNTTHYIKVQYNGKTFPALPSYTNIEIGHIRSMVRALEISKECANSHIPKLFKSEELKPAPGPAKSSPSAAVPAKPAGTPAPHAQDSK
jgi:hypothetical protein